MVSWLELCYRKTFHDSPMESKNFSFYVISTFATDVRVILKWRFYDTNSISLSSGPVGRHQIVWKCMNGRQFSLGIALDWYVSGLLRMWLECLLATLVSNWSQFSFVGCQPLKLSHISRRSFLSWEGFETPETICCTGFFQHVKNSSNKRVNISRHFGNSLMNAVGNLSQPSEIGAESDEREK